MIAINNASQFLGSLKVCLILVFLVACKDAHSIPQREGEKKSDTAVFQNSIKKYIQEFDTSRPIFITPKGYYILDSAAVFQNINGGYKLVVLEKDDLKNKENAQHYNIVFAILKKDSQNRFVEWLTNTNLIKDIGRNCPADGFQNIVSKGSFFTIEYVLCRGWNFENCFLTFKYDSLSNQVLLHRFDKEYTDRTNPNKELPGKSFTRKDFGLIDFQNVSDDMLDKMKAANK